MHLDLSRSCLWSLCGTGSKGEKLEIPCRLPNDNASILLDAGVIPDPYAGLNEKEVQWIGRRDWIFRGVFSLDGEPEENVFLHIESLDTCAGIFLNGKEIGTSDNMFRRFREWVSPCLKKGENRIEIRLRSALAVAGERAKAYPFDLGRNDNNAVPHLQFVRKVQCHGGWDWGICLPVCGVYGEIDLRSVRSARIERIATEQSFSGAAAELAVHVELEAPCAGACSLSVEFDGKRETRTVRVNGGKTVETFRFGAGNPKRWNPAGFGGQFRYPLTVSTESESVAKQIGFRTLELVRVPDGEDSETFFFRVNGNDIFCKGANWIPYEAMPGRETPERLRDLLEAARDAHMNMIRVWGGGKYESELFYELCDEFGILVWQDCMFACVKYPENREFLDSVDRELEYQIGRLSPHPCVALWCGDNEIFMCHGQYPENRTRFTGAVLYDRFNRAVMRTVRAYAGTCPAWDSSPSNGPEAFHLPVGTESRGDLHYWGVWHGGGPFSRYYEIRPRFCSEFGFQSFPSLRTIRTRIRPEEENLSAPEMEAHQKNEIGNARILAAFAEYFRIPETFGQTVYLSQVQQALAIRTAVEFWRTLRPHCMGTLYWQWNDNWPVVSWSAIDYSGDRKILYYETKRFYAPLLLTAHPQDGKYRFCAVNDRTETAAGTLRIRFHDFVRHSAATVRSETLRIPAGAVAAVELPAPEVPEAGFYELRWEGEESLRSEFHPAGYKNHPLPNARIHAEIRKDNSGFSVELTASDYAFFVFAELKTVSCRWSDNALTLYPGEPAMLRAVPAHDMTEMEFQKELRVNDLKYSR